MCRSMSLVNMSIGVFVILFFSDASLDIRCMSVGALIRGLSRRDPTFVDRSV